VIAAIFKSGLLQKYWSNFDFYRNVRLPRPTGFSTDARGLLEVPLLQETKLCRVDSGGQAAGWFVYSDYNIIWNMGSSMLPMFQNPRSKIIFY
jgi:hypothetical protein